jgi:hypothetical protein
MEEATGVSLVNRLTLSAAHRVVPAVDLYHLALAAAALGIFAPAPLPAEQIPLADEEVRPADKEQ